ncbi:MAG: transposase [Candidatus Cloacimonetes bacterium]|nr:transposase [Candidatus Cloacimonadota bacterium]
MLHLILLLILESSKSVNQGIIRNHCNSMKTPVNDMLNNISYNWRNFLFCFARIFAAISFNHHKDKGTLIIDDTCKKKSGNKVQHLSWFYDHANDEYFTGFQNVTCAWCNGRSTIPIDFEFKIGNKKTKHATKSDYARGSHAEQRVRFAKQKKTEIAIQMIKRAFQRNFPINYILWDS